MRFLSFRNDTVFEAAMQSRTAVVRGLPMHFLFRVSLLITDCLVDLTGDAAVRGRRCFTRVRSIAFFNDLRLGKQEILVFLDVLLADEVF